MSCLLKICRSKRITAAPAILLVTMLISLCTVPVSAQAQTSAVIGANLQRITNGVLMLMGYSLTPDVTTGSLSFTNAESGNPGFAMTSLGAGFTVSRDFPLYLEGTAADSRYDPTFVVSDGTNSRSIPSKWNSLSATVGIGWDFPIAHDLVKLLLRARQERSFHCGAGPREPDGAGHLVSRQRPPRCRRGRRIAHAGLRALPAGKRD